MLLMIGIKGPIALDHFIMRRHSGQKASGRPWVLWLSLTDWAVPSPWEKVPVKETVTGKEKKTVP